MPQVPLDLSANNTSRVSGFQPRPWTPQTAMKRLHGGVKHRPNRRRPCLWLPPAAMRSWPRLNSVKLIPIHENDQWSSWGGGGGNLQPIGTALISSQLLVSHSVWIRIILLQIFAPSFLCDNTFINWKNYFHLTLKQLTFSVHFIWNIFIICYKNVWFFCALKITSKRFFF